MILPPDHPRQATKVQRAQAGAASAGFSFIEMMVVMGVMAMLMGLAIGFLQNVGSATVLAQARSVLQESATKCVISSSGGVRTILTLREDEETGNVRIGAAIARPVLTHQFEALDFASDLRRVQVNGSVERLLHQGRQGNCAKFAGGTLSLPPESRFAMTEGLEIRCWIKPEAEGGTVSLIRGGESGTASYELKLARDGNSKTFNVELHLRLRDITPGMRDGAAELKAFKTKNAPVLADGRWVHLHVRYDGQDASIRVNDLEAYESAARTARRRARGTEEEGVDEGTFAKNRRIMIPDTGAVGIVIGDGYRGLMDQLLVHGVFRARELEEVMPDRLVLRRPAMPVRIEYYNGRLDPEIHSGDVYLVFEDIGLDGALPLVVRLGQHGTVDVQDGGRVPREEEPIGTAPTTTPDGNGS